MSGQLREGLSRREATLYVASRRENGERIAFTNGCFDILHVGHLRYLRAARELADLLIVGVNTDASVAKLKGPGRPLVSQEERAELLLALDPVDLVVFFDDPTPLALIQAISPDVLVKGGDYDPNATEGPTHIVGSEFVRGRGGAVYTIPLVAGRSTSRLEKLLASKT